MLNRYLEAGTFAVPCISGGNSFVVVFIHGEFYHSFLSVAIVMPRYSRTFTQRVVSGHSLSNL